MPEPVRLNKYLAHTLGISRREADVRIEQGRVAVNGAVANIGKIINPERDVVSMDTADISRRPHRYTYVLMNKPVGYICSRKQQGDTPTIYSLLPHHFQHLKVAGRLDKDSSGLLLLTDDGDTIFKLTHPSFRKLKKYVVGLNKPLTPDHQAHIERGVTLEDGVSKLDVRTLPKSTLPNRYEVSMFEGRNRQIRRTFKQLGYSVTFLDRQKLGPYSLAQLGEKRYLQISQ